MMQLQLNNSKNFNISNFNEGYNNNETTITFKVDDNYSVDQLVSDFNNSTSIIVVNGGDKIFQNKKTFYIMNINKAFNEDHDKGFINVCLIDRAPLQS